MKKLFLTILIVIMTYPAFGQRINIGDLNRLLSSWPYNVSFGGTLGITGDITLSGAITSNQSYAAAQTVFYFRSALTATSGEHNNVRGRAMNQAIGASTSDIRGVYGQATTTAALFGGTGTGVFANFIAKNTSTTVTGRALFAEAETEATPTAITNMYTAYFRTKAHKAPTSDYYMLMMEDQLVSTGFAMDAYLGMKSTSWTGGNSATYGIDMNGIDGLTTGDWRMHNGALWNNSTSSLLSVTEANINIIGNLGVNDAAPGTQFQISNASAYITLKNTTAENGEGEAETRVIFEDHANVALAQIEGSHSGAADDTKGKFIVSTHTGSALTTALTIDDTQAAIFAGTVNFFVDSSSADDAWGFVDTRITALTTGLNIYVQIAVVNTDGATLQINALGAKDVHKEHNVALATGDVEVGQILHLIYDGTDFQMMSVLAQ